MTTMPLLPWQLWPFLAITVACFLAAGFVTVMAVARWWRARRVRRPGFVLAEYRAWDDYPAEFSREWRRSR